jgi:hypothetical protein
MIWKDIVRPRAIALDSTRWSAISGFAGKTAETVSDFACIVHNLAMDVRDSYRPELHYMRGPGPKWHAKHQAGRDSIL